ncbi:MAG: PDZ domain-containing protein [Acidobacteriia bacterium]|nr:PDZ domain-containing protein [Terriglobia bacterium]
MKTALSLTLLAALLLLFFVSGSILAAAPPETRLMRFPDIWHDQVVFVYAEDLWVSSTQGGAAHRLTSHPGDELFPKFSPDGKWIAFTGQYGGNSDVYVVPAAGGEPKRLTYHPSFNMVLGWSPDGRILFRSNRASELPDYDRLFLISPEGGVPEMLSVPRASLASFAPDRQRIAYNFTSQEFRTWKRYRGGWKSPIAIFDLKKHTYDPLPTTEAMDMFPMWYGNTIYFISDRDGVMNLYRYDMAAKKTSQLTRYTEFDIKWPSLGPDAIVYENGGLLYEYDLKKGEAQKVPIYVGSDEVAARPEFMNVGARIDWFDISPSGVRALFSARGEVFTVPAEHGSPRNLTNTSGVHELHPVWSPDGKWIAYFSDRSGENEIYIQAQKGGGEVAITHDGASTRYRYNLAWSPDSKKLAYSDKKLRLWYVDIDKKEPVLVDTAEFQTRMPASWSPDSRWLAYAKPVNGSGKDLIFLYSLEQKKVNQISEGFYDDSSPVFDPEGKYLYFLSDRFFFPTGSAIDLRFNYYNTRGIFALTLKADEAAPFGPENDEEKDVDEKKADEKKAEAEKKADADKKADDKKPESDKKSDAKPAATGDKPSEEKKSEEKKHEVKPIQIDLAGLGRRVSQVPVPPGIYARLLARKDKLFFMSAPIEAAELGRPGPPKPAGSLHVYDVKKREDKVLLDGIGGYELDTEGKKLIYGAGETIGIIEAAPGKKVGDGKINTGAMQVLSDPKEEWKEILREAWRMERDFYWDPNMGGLDWAAVGKRYEALLPWVAHRSDLNYIIGEMIAELDTSHTYVGGGDLPDRKRVGVGMLGADLEGDGGFFKITKIYPGENWNDATRSPLTEPGLKVKEGNYLIAVEGQPARADREPYAYFQNMANRVVTLKINDKPSTEGAWDVAVKTIGGEGGLRYLNWVENNRRKVEAATGGRVGYMHVPDTAVSGVMMFDKYFNGQLGKDGMIVDERFNHGGWSPDFYTEKLGRRLLLALSPREGKEFVPQTAFFGPKVMIVNEQAGSGGDLFPFYFKKEKIGPIVGTRTWGGLIGIGGFPPTLDGGFVSAPGWAWWEPNDKGGGEWVVENHGVDPDYVVDQRPDLVLQGRDPQLEKAIELAKEGLKTMPAPMHRPPFPIKALRPAVAQQPSPQQDKGSAPQGR